MTEGSEFSESSELSEFSDFSLAARISSVRETQGRLPNMFSTSSVKMTSRLTTLRQAWRAFGVLFQQSLGALVLLGYDARHLFVDKACASSL